jgi:hypothetical protein
MRGGAGVQARRCWTASLLIGVPRLVGNSGPVVGPGCSAIQCRWAAAQHFARTARVDAQVRDLLDRLLQAHPACQVRSTQGSTRVPMSIRPGHRGRGDRCTLPRRALDRPARRRRDPPARTRRPRLTPRPPTRQPGTPPVRGTGAHPSGPRRTVIPLGRIHPEHRTRPVTITAAHPAKDLG